MFAYLSILGQKIMTLTIKWHNVVKALLVDSQFPEIGAYGSPTPLPVSEILDQPLDEKKWR